MTVLAFRVIGTPMLRCDACGLVWTPDQVAYLMSHTRLAHGREATRNERTPR